MPKLIILRGNSGCGKSSTSRLLRERLGSNIALVEQDYLRRTVLKEKDIKGGHNIELIKQVVEFILSRGQNVCLEGILFSEHYREMIGHLLHSWPEHYVYYFDVSLEETLRRHATKSNADEFGVKEITEWYTVKDVLGVKGEEIIPESKPQKEIVEMIMEHAGFTAG